MNLGLYRKSFAHLNDDEFSGRVLGVAQLLSEAQRDAALRRLAAVWTEVVQLWSRGRKSERWKCDVHGPRVWLVFDSSLNCGRQGPCFHVEWLKIQNLFSLWSNMMNKIRKIWEYLTFLTWKNDFYSLKSLQMNLLSMDWWIKSTNWLCFRLKWVHQRLSTLLLSRLWLQRLVSSDQTHVVWRRLYWRAAPGPCSSPSCAAPVRSCAGPSRTPALGRTVCRRPPAAWRSAPPLCPWRAAGWTGPAARRRSAAWRAARAAGCVETCSSGWPESAGRERKAGTLSGRRCLGFHVWGPPDLNNEPPRRRSPGLERRRHRGLNFQNKS